MNYDLCDHGVVFRRYGIACIDSAIHSDAVSSGKQQIRDLSGARHEMLLGDLGIDTALYGMTLEHDVLLTEAKLLPGCYSYLLHQKIRSGFHFRNPVLNLDTGIHLHEIVLPALIHDELNGTGTVVVNSLCSQSRIPVHPFPGLIADGRRRRLLYKLLVITLHRTVAFPQGHNITELIPYELDLNVTRMNHQLLDIHGVIAEGIGGLTLGSIEGILEILRREAFTHASSTAAGACLYHHRKAYLLRFLHGKCRIKNRFLCSRHHRHPCRHHHLSGS